MSANQRGPCYSGVYDSVTGAYFYGENFDMSKLSDRVAFDVFYASAHPIIKQRIDSHQLNRKNGTAQVNPKAGTIGAHSEVVALDRALKARELTLNKPVLEEEFPSFYIHNRSTMAASAGQPMNRCDNCIVITKGVNTVLHN